MGFGLYRPRRPSYTFATKSSRQRSESYRYATRREHADSTSEVSNGEDFIEGVLRSKARKISYLKATKHHDEVDSSSSSSPKVGVVVCENTVSPAKVDMEKSFEQPLEVNTQQTQEQCTKYALEGTQYSSDDNAIYESQNYVNHKWAAHETVSANNYSSPNATKAPKGQEPANYRPSHRQRSDNKPESTKAATSVMTVISYNKNLVVLCASFILVFSSYRAIQNLQSSMHSEGHLGILTMMVVHISLIVACLLAPIIINIFKAKWALCIGILCFLIWFGANFHPTFYTLIPTSLCVGFGQGILWNAESSYILKLAFDSAKATRGQLDQEMFRFHGIFLACFQTTHIWGNLISSLLLSRRANEIASARNLSISPTFGLASDHLGSVGLSNISGDVPILDGSLGDSPLPMSHCGALHRCKGPVVTVFPGGFGGE